MKQTHGSSVMLTGQAGGSSLDLARAEGEGMATARDPSTSSDAERHRARASALSRSAMVFDLASEARQLTLPPEALHAARTLARLDTLRLTLLKLTAGSAVREHQVAHQIALHTVSGRVVVHAEGQPQEVPAGYVIVLDRGIAHDILAKEDSVVLLTVSMPQASA